MYDGVEVLAAREGVYEQRAGDAEYGQAHAAAAELDERQDTDDADDDVERGHLYRAGEDLAQAVVHDGVVEERAGADEHEHDVVPGQGVDLDVLLAGGVGEVAEDYHAAHEDGQAHFLAGAGPQRGVDAVGGEQGHEYVDGYLGLAVPEARVRLAVVLAHYGLDVLHGADVDVVERALLLLRVEGRAVEVLDVGLLVVRLYRALRVGHVVAQHPLFLFMH